MAIAGSGGAGSDKPPRARLIEDRRPKHGADSHVGLRFSDRVFVCLIPTRVELLGSGMGSDLYWSPEDFAEFRWQAEVEIEGAVAVLRVSRAEAMDALYQPGERGVLEEVLNESEALLHGLWGSLAAGRARRGSVDMLARDGCVDEVQAAMRTRGRDSQFKRLIWVVTWKCSPMAAMQC